MTIDERIEKLAENQEKTQMLLADVVDPIRRLERIALAHSLDIDDHDRRLAELEQRRGKKPQ